MEVTKLKQELKDNVLRCFYIFTGDEWYIQQQYTQQISKISGKPIMYIDTIDDIYSTLRNMTFIDTSYVYVLVNDTTILNIEKVYNQIYELMHRNILILKLSKVDKKTKFYAKFKPDIIEFKPMDKTVVKKYAKKEIAMTDKYLDILVDICGCNLGQIKLEADKIKRYTAETYVPKHEKDRESAYYNDNFKKLMDKDIIHVENTDNNLVFEMIDSILGGHINKSFKLKDECLHAGQSVMSMLVLLHSSAKSVLQVQTCREKDVEAYTGLAKWQIAKARKFKNTYSDVTLENLLYDIYNCQKGIVSGTIDEKYVMDYILVRLFM